MSVEENRARSKAWYWANRDRALAQRKAYAEAHPDRIKANLKRARDRYGSKYRKRKFAKIYNTTVERITELDSQTVCEICGGCGTDIDHCHKRNMIRGKLCPKCNKALGLFGDNPDLVRKAANYLEVYASRD